MTTIFTVCTSSKHFFFAFVEPYGDSVAVENGECACAAAAAGGELLTEMSLHGGEVDVTTNQLSLQMRLEVGGHQGDSSELLLAGRMSRMTVGNTTCMQHIQFLLDFVFCP